MARIRTVKPAFFDDFDFVRSLSRDERLFYIGLWVRCCDDRGVFLDSPPWICKEVFPYESDVTVEKVVGWLDHLADNGQILRYALEGKDYCLVLHFLDHQQINRPSKRFCHPIPGDWQFDEGSWKWVTLPIICKSLHGALSEPSLSPHSARASEVELEMEVELDLTPSGSSPSADAMDTPPPISAQAIIALWNTICGDKLPHVSKVTELRKKKIKSRLSDVGTTKEAWTAYFKRVRSTPFLYGENARDWKCDFDWVIDSEGHVAKIVEGSYLKSERAPAADPRAKALKAYQRLDAGRTEDDYEQYVFRPARQEAAAGEEEP